MSFNKRDLTIHDTTTKIIVNTEHLQAIEYLLEATVRHERTSSEEHNLHLMNAAEVITKALKADRPNNPKGVNAFWGGQYKL